MILHISKAEIMGNKKCLTFYFLIAIFLGVTFFEQSRRIMYLDFF